MPITAKEANRLDEIKAEIAEIWKQACQHDGIEFTSKFVVFSHDNPFVPAHTAKMKEFMAERNRIRHNLRRRERHEALTSLGLKRVRGAQGGVYYE